MRNCSSMKQPIALLARPVRHDSLFHEEDNMSAHMRLIGSLVDSQGAATPDATALVCGSQVLTYRELNGLANQLGHRLQALGVGPDVVVGLILPRSPAMVVGALGILKAGGAYLPMDPSFSEARIASLLDGAPQAVIGTL